MFQLQPVGWLDGGTALSVVIFAAIFGIYSFYKSRKLKAKLLAVTGVAIFSVGFTLLGPAVDFLVILITTTNLTPVWLYGILSYIWTAPVAIFGLYIGFELMAPSKKWYILSIYILLAVIFEILLFYASFTDPELIFKYPVPLPNGTDLLSTSIKPTSIAFIFMMIFMISGLIFNGFGFLSKAIKSSGILRRKFLYLSLGWILFIVCGMFDALFEPGPVTFFIRIGTMCSVVFLYVGVTKI